MRPIRSYAIIILSFLIGIMLSIIPLPHWAIWYRPQWVALMLIYWVVAVPERVGLGTAWILGLLLDTVFGSVLGEHALALVIITYFANTLYLQMRVLTLWHQALTVLALIFIYQIIILLIQGVLGQMHDMQNFWLPAITSMLFWPWLFILLRDFRRRYAIQ